MPVNVRVNVRNVERLKRKLRRMPNNVARAVADAQEKNAQELTAAAKRAVPKRTGILSQNIGHYAVEGSRGLIRRVFAGLQGPGLWLNGYWAHFVEFGTSKTAAQPFFFVNLRALRSRFRGRVTRAQRKAIKESVR